MSKDEDDPWSDENKRKKKEDAWGGAQDDNAPKDNWGEATSSASEGFPDDPWKSSRSPYDDDFPSNHADANSAAEEERKKNGISKHHHHHKSGKESASGGPKDEVDEARRQLEALRKQDAELKRRSPLTYCSIQGIVGGALPGAFGGAVFGAFSVAYEGAQQEMLRQPGFSRYILAGAGSGAVQFGSWLAAYTSTKCLLEVKRQKKDVINSFGGGFVAGALVAAMGRGSPRMCIISGLGNGAMIAAMDLMTGHH